MSTNDRESALPEGEPDRASAEVVTMLVYGRSITEEDDDYIHLAVECIDRAVRLGAPGMNVIYLFPLCKLFCGRWYKITQMNNFSALHSFMVPRCWFSI